MSQRIARGIADFLATSPEEVVARRSVRGLFQEGEARPRPNGKGHQNNVSKRFRQALRAFERQGWLAREEEALVILDRSALWAYANDRAAREGIKV